MANSIFFFTELCIFVDGIINAYPSSLSIDVMLLIFVSHNFRKHCKKLKFLRFLLISNT